MEFILRQKGQTCTVKCRPKQKLRVLYKYMNSETDSLFIFQDGLKRLVPCLLFKDLPGDSELFWLPTAQSLEVWKAPNLVTVYTGDRCVRIRVSDLMTTLQSVYDAAQRAKAGGAWQVNSDLYIRGSEQKLDLSQPLLNIYADTFEIKMK